MSTFEFHQVECPKCHGKINSVGRLGGPTKCMYCGTDFEITGTMTKEIESPERLVPFKTSRNDFERAAFEMLVNADGTPNNIFDLVTFKHVEGIYLPVFLYEGIYDCSWTCKVKQSENGADPADKPVKIKYRSQSGVTKGDYAFVCLACEGPEVRSESAEYLRSFNYDSGASKPFDPADLNDYYFLTPNLDKRKTWNNRGESTLRNTAQMQVMAQIRESDFKDFKCDVSEKPDHDGRPILIPFWMLYYEYAGELHHIMMDGTGKNGIKGTMPIDHDRTDKVEKPFKISKIIMAAAIILPIILAFFGLFDVALITLAAMWVLFFVHRSYAGWHKKKIIDKARKERQNIWNKRYAQM